MMFMNCNSKVVSWVEGGIKLRDVSCFLLFSAAFLSPVFYDFHGLSRCALASGRGDGANGGVHDIMFSRVILWIS